LMVKKCPYAETPGAAWIAETTIGEALDATIEFDGTWNIQFIPYVFNTEEFPWVAWITLSGELCVKKLNADTFVILATNAIKICSVRGWDNLYTPGNDQGLLLIYVKSDGLVYYRGYCKQANYSYLWETEQTLSEFSGSAVDVNAFRTNDFRIGINVLDSAGITHTYITTRNWAGMSISPAGISLGFDCSIDVVQIKYSNTYEQEHLTIGTSLAIYVGYNGADNQYLHIENVDDGTGNFGVVVHCTLQYDITNATVADFTITDVNSEVYYCTSIQRSSLCQYTLTFTDFNGADHDGAAVSLSCSSTSTLNGAGTVMNAFSGIFVPTGLVHPIIPIPELEAIYNE